ncbi:hypothetical protein RRF57_011709 [Xylaria bambusicola]|uniref:Uncharacterized protein n=1 Tax=Xylaria bambusicola TaxID=326684 RepID=A0AAN7UU55_9PEZI
MGEVGEVGAVEVVVCWWSDVAAMDALSDEESGILGYGLNGADDGEIDGDDVELEVVAVGVVPVGCGDDDAGDDDDEVGQAADEPTRTSQPRRMLLSMWFLNRTNGLSSTTIFENCKR